MEHDNQREGPYPRIGQAPTRSEMNLGPTYLMAAVVLAALLQGCTNAHSGEQFSPSDEMQNAGAARSTTTSDDATIVVYRSPT